MALILLGQRVQDLPLAAGVAGRSQGVLLALNLRCSHKGYRCTTTLFIADMVRDVQRKVNDSLIFFEGLSGSERRPLPLPIFMFYVGSHRTAEKGRQRQPQNDERAKKLKADGNEGRPPPHVQVALWSAPHWRSRQQALPKDCTCSDSSESPERARRAILLSESQARWMLRCHCCM